MDLAELDYELPESAIAQRPAPRGSSRLLVLDASGDDRHRHVGDLPRLLRPGDLLVVNDTRVLPARLFARRPSGGQVEILLLEAVGPVEWRALLRPGRRLTGGATLLLDGLEATVVDRDDAGRFHLRFSEPVEPHLDRLGHLPLPPYIRRSDDAADRERYQTVFAHRPGAVAAPTAGLHFDEPLLEALRDAGIDRAPVTLHVGIGTFRPITVERSEDHRMDAERWEVPAATADAIRRTRERGGRVVAIGTTVVRTLETAAAESSDGRVTAGAGRTELFITPGHRFRAVDVLLTNFHLPRSTLLMLVSAFAGRERVLAAYREAVASGYRFYSYGDAMLAERAD